MKKTYIKQLLREGLMTRLKEMGKKPEKPSESNSGDDKGNFYNNDSDENESSNDKEYNELDAGEKKKVQTLTRKIGNATQGNEKILKLSQVMGASGAICGDSKCDPDNASDRSAIGKAVSGKPDADGKVRHLNLQQANSMGKVVDNPPAYN